MSYSSKQKALKRPDEFQKLGQQAVPWMERHGRTVMFGVVGIGIVGIAIAIGTHVAQRRELAANEEFGQALRLLERPVSGATEPKSEVDAAGEPAPAEPFENEDRKPFASEADRDEAIVKRLGEFRAKHRGKGAAVLAALPMASALLRLGKPDEALAAADDFLAAAKPDDLLRQAALDVRGHALRRKKDYDQAQLAFKGLADSAGPDFLKGEGQYALGIVSREKGDLQAAATQLRDVEARFPTTSAASQARAALEKLANAGVAEAKAPPTPVTLAPAAP